MFRSLVVRHSQPLMTTLVFLFPVFVCTVKSWHSSLYLVMVLCSFFLVKGQWADSETETKQLFYVLLVFFLIAAVSLFNAEDLYQWFKRLSKLSYLFGIIILFLAAQKMKLDFSRPFVKGVTLGSLCLSGVAIYQTCFLSIERAHGMTHPIVFGNVAMLFTVLLLAHLVYRPTKEKWYWSLLAMCAALVASFLSLSRGCWVVIPLLALVSPFFFGKQLIRRKSFALIGLVLFCLVGVSLGFGSTINGQLDRTLGNVESFFEGEDLNSSIGQRFLMWDIALDMFKQNPILGSGLGDFKNDSIVMMKSGETALKVEHSHAHNIFFESLATMGLLGMLSMIFALIIMPWSIFWSAWKGARNIATRRAAVSGMLVVFCFTVFGLSESWISRSPFIIVYCVSVFVFLSAIAAHKKPSTGRTGLAETQGGAN